MSKIIALVAFAFLILVVPSSSFAQNKNIFPAVPQGPGYILPDSPLYVFDKLSQEFKLVLAFTPERRATVRNQIVGERLAELRVMHARGNSEGVSIALYELSNEAKSIGDDLKEAQLSGKNVSRIAKSINDSLRANRDILSEASLNSNEELSLKLDSANESLLIAKVNVENYLNPVDLEDAVGSDLEDEIETAVLGVETKAEDADKKIEKLQKKTEKEVEKEARKNEAEDKIETKKLENEGTSGEKKAALKELIQKKKEAREKRKKMLEERKKKFQEAREALKKSKEASRKIKEAKELRKISPIPVITGTQ